MKKWIFGFVLLLLAIPCQAEQIIYVDADAPGPDYDGSSWTNAYNYLQDGLTDANSAVKPVEIWVAEGTYKPDQGAGVTPGDWAATFQLINGVTIKGGYAGFGQPDPNARDIGEYETILSGDLNGNDVDVNDPADLWDEPSRDDNSYHVVGGSDTNTTAVLDGFTITGGNAHGSYPDYCGGGGMYNSSGSPRVTNCTFICNASKGWGGGMFNYHSSPTLANCTFSTNGGGGMDNDFSDPRLTNCTFYNNNWSAMYCNLGSLTLTNCTLTGNLGVRGGGAIFNQHSSCTLTNCILWGNIPDEIYETQGVTVITYSNVKGSWSGEGNIDIDPCFADPNNGDYHLQSQAGRWDPNTESWVIDANTSPCIDAGNPGCPLGDEPNDANNIRINMGAYGGTAEASKTPTNWRNIADLTNDWAVDFSDLKVFVDYWLDTGECIPSDLDRSQAVDFVDFAIFARQRRGNNYILLEIYSDGWGNLLETATIEEEGQITILVYEEEPYSYPAAMYYVYASRDGYYTEIYYCEAFGSPPNNFITVDVDLDPIVPGKFNGVIFMTQWFFSDRYLPNTDVNVVDGNTVVTQFQTDQQGRFATEIEPGNYDFEFISDWQEYHLEPVSIGGEYQDFFFPDHAQAFKPSIYIYPEETIELDVDIVFPHGGRITTSIPDYNNGWHITVEPSGIIDGQFEYLFYESLQPDYGQYAAGWVVIREQLEDFFRNNMGQTGFNQKEIDDFIEYWIPILTEYPYYAIYPQYRGELEEMIKLEFSAQPESLIRLIYSVRGMEDNNLNIQEPVIPPFTRDGFTVTEWGVILK